MTDQSIGRVVGGILLIAGSCIGAAMLGLPVLSAHIGFIPAQCGLALAWVFMLATGLLLLEVNLWLGSGVSIVTMAAKTLGHPGRIAAWLTYLFLFYMLMVALISGSGQTLHAFARDLLPFEPSRPMVDISFVLLFGILVYCGTQAVDFLNRWLMLGLVVCYVALLFVAVPRVDGTLLLQRDWNGMYAVIPAMIISFGFHNLIPSLTNYLECNTPRLKWTLIVGSSLPFGIYWLWQSIVLGMVPQSDLIEALQLEKAATLVLHEATDNPAIIVFAGGFGLFAMLTTLIGVSLSFVDFLADGLNWHKRFGLCLMVLVPPLLLSMWQQEIFLTMLGRAGGLGAVTLFGILPPLMVYRGRYILGFQGPRLLPGGKFSLLVILLVAFAILGIEVINELGLGEIPADADEWP